MNVIGNHAVVVFVTHDKKGSMQSKFKISRVIKRHSLFSKAFLCFNFVTICSQYLLLEENKFKIKILNSRVIFCFTQIKSQIYFCRGKRNNLQKLDVFSGKTKYYYLQGTLMIVYIVAGARVATCCIGQLRKLELYK